jgi:glycosyltransferase involved in cell wall biosynthesis
MEALAAGVPVVARDLPVLREVFGPAVHYATSPTDFADALCTAMTVDDPAARAVGRDLARRHTWSAAAEQHLDLYQRLLREWRQREA